MNNPMVSVIIATYNRHDSLVDTLKDVLQCDYDSFEVVVVEQSEKEVTNPELLSLQKNSRVIWINLQPPGLTRARNVGLGKSSGDVIIYVDDDVRIPNPEFIRAHVLALEENRVAAVAGRILEPDRPPLTVKNRIGDLGFTGSRKPGFGSDWSGPSLSVRGCNMSFKRQPLIAVGGFDESYTRSSFREDTDISFRLRKKGYRIFFEANAWLYHLSERVGGTRDASIQFDPDIIANDLKFCRKNLKFVQRTAWMSRIYASRVIKAGIKSRNVRERHRVFIKLLKEGRG